MTIKLSRRSWPVRLMTELYEVPEHQIDFCRLFWGVVVLPVIVAVVVVVLPFALIAATRYLRAIAGGLVAACVIVVALLATELLLIVVLALLVLTVVGAAYIGLVLGAAKLSNAAVRRGLLNGVTTRAYPIYRRLKIKTCPMVEVTQ